MGDPAKQETLPHAASGEWTYNASPTIQDNVVTADGRQYVVWVGDDRHPIIAGRDTGSDTWGTFDLADVPDNPLLAPTAEDGHNFYSLGIDAEGYLHVAGNVHANKLRYVRSKRPHTLDAWEDAGMIGPDEGRVSYPKFFNLPDGTLLFLYRDGVAGDGDTFLNRYDPTAGQWGRVHKLVDGGSDSVSFYPNHVSTRDGSIHIAGVWRSGSPNTARDVTYLRSDDGGDTWVQADGTPQTIPLRHGNGDVALPTAPEGSGLLNGGGLEVDTDGRPHVAQLMYDERGRTQVFHIWHDGTRWRYEAATRVTHRMDLESEAGYPDNRTGHPSIATTAAGGTFILYRAHEHGQQLRAIDVTPDRQRCEFTLAETRVDFWNPVFDTRALYDHDRLDFLVVPTGHPQAMDDEQLSEWSSVAAALVSVTGEDLEVLADHCRDLPPDERAHTTPGMRVDLVALTDRYVLASAVTTDHARVAATREGEQPAT